MTKFSKTRIWLDIYNSAVRSGYFAQAAQVADDGLKEAEKRFG